MATAAQITTWISEVEAQRQKVALGQAFIELWRDGRRVRVEVTGIKDLDQYLQTLRSELTEAQLAEGITPTRRRRAIGLAFRN
jgi:hypothetical protein